LGIIFHSIDFSNAEFSPEEKALPKAKSVKEADMVNVLRDLDSKLIFSYAFLFSL